MTNEGENKNKVGGDFPLLPPNYKSSSLASVPPSSNTSQPQQQQQQQLQQQLQQQSSQTRTSVARVVESGGSDALRGKSIQELAVDKNIDLERMSDVEFDKLKEVVDNAPTVYEFHPRLQKFEDLLHQTFKLKRRGVTISSEIKNGFVAFVSCCFALPVIPDRLANAGYDFDTVLRGMAISLSIGGVLCGLITNLPMYLAPPVTVSIYLASTLREAHMGPRDGSIAVIISGVFMLILAYRPFMKGFNYVVPTCIQIGTGIGIGLLTSLSGFTESDVIVPGKYTLLDSGFDFKENYVSILGLLIIVLSLHYHIVGGFAWAMVICTIFSWLDHKNLHPDPAPPVPNEVLGVDTSKSANNIESSMNTDNWLLVFKLFFLMTICTNGLMRSFSDLAGLTVNNRVPRGRWMYVICGVASIISGVFGGPPVLIFPESGAAIKSGARTGLSAVVCGLLFGFSGFFPGLFKSVPTQATAPLLVAVGVIIFGNIKKLNLTDWKSSFPAFLVFFLIPFTFNITTGVAMGWAFFLIVRFLTKDLEIFIFLFTRSVLPKVYSKYIKPRLEEEYGDLTFWKYLYSLFPYNEILGIADKSAKEDGQSTTEDDSNDIDDAADYRPSSISAEQPMNYNEHHLGIQ